MFFRAPSLLTFFPIFCVVVGVTSDSIDNQVFIAGKRANDVAYSFLALLQRLDAKTQARCGAIIVTENMLLTACHCVADFDEKGEPELRPAGEFLVLTGLKNLMSNESQAKRLTSIHLNPLCHENRTLLKGGGSPNHVVEYDLAHFFIYPPFTFSGNLKPANFLNDKSYSNYDNFLADLEKQRSECSGASWWCSAKSDDNSGCGSMILKTFPVKILMPKKCNRRCNRQRLKPGLDDYFCASTPTVDDATDCLTESDYPIVCGGYPVGIASWGYACESHFPRVFTKISAHFEYLFGENLKPTKLWKFIASSDLKTREVNSSNVTETPSMVEIFETETDVMIVPEIPPRPANADNARFTEDVYEDDGSSERPNKRLSALFLALIIIL